MPILIGCGKDEKMEIGYVLCQLLAKKIKDIIIKLFALIMQKNYTMVQRHHQRYNCPHTLINNLIHKINLAQRPHINGFYAYYEIIANNIELFGNGNSQIQWVLGLVTQTPKLASKQLQIGI